MGTVRDVEHPRAGDHHHAVTGEAVAPAEVDVVAAAGKCRVKSPEFLPDVAADQHAGGIDGEGIAAAVVLALVQFVGVDQRQPFGPAARGKADVDEPPPGVRDQLQDPTQAFGIGGTEYNEKGMRLAYTDLEPNERAEIYYRYAQEPRNLLSYRQLRLWAVARTGNWGPQGGERLQVKIGTDKRNYYLFQTRLNPSLNGGAVTTEAWRPEVVIDFERWMALRISASRRSVSRSRAITGSSAARWSCRCRGAPSLTVATAFASRRARSAVRVALATDSASDRIASTR